MKTILIILIILLVNFQLFGQIKQQVTDSTISYYGQHVYADTVLMNYDYHVKISLSETLKTERVKKTVTISKDITLDSLKLVLEKALKTINIETEIRLIEVIDYREIYNNGSSVTLLEGRFEFYVNNEFDIHKIYNHLIENFSPYIFKGFIAIPYINDSTMKKINDNLKETAKRKILLIAKEFSKVDSDDKISIQTYFGNNSNNYYDDYTRYQYGDTKRIYINNELPKIRTNWNYTFTIRTK